MKRSFSAPGEGWVVSGMATVQTNKNKIPHATQPGDPQRPTAQLDFDTGPCTTAVPDIGPTGVFVSYKIETWPVTATPRLGWTGWDTEAVCAGESHGGSPSRTHGHFWGLGRAGLAETKHLIRANQLPRNSRSPWPSVDVSAAVPRQTQTQPFPPVQAPGPQSEQTT